MERNTGNHTQAVRLLIERAEIMVVVPGVKKTENTNFVTSIHKSRKVGEVGMILALNADEWTTLLGLLEDISQEDDVNEAYPIQTRIAIKSIIQKLGGTYFGTMVT